MIISGVWESLTVINIHQQDYKCPIGNWPRLQVYKDAGRVFKQQFKAVIEGWMMCFLTKHAEPAWSVEEVQVYLAKVKAELDAGWHIYHKSRRVWAQKPFDKEEKTRMEPIVKRMASASWGPKPQSKKTHVEGGEEGEKT